VASDFGLFLRVGEAGFSWVDDVWREQADIHRANRHKHPRTVFFIIFLLRLESNSLEFLIHGKGTTL
jgi:hypothetical protein